MCRGTTTPKHNAYNTQHAHRAFPACSIAGRCRRTCCTSRQHLSAGRTLGNLNRGPAGPATACCSRRSAVGRRLLSARARRRSVVLHCRMSHVACCLLHVACCMRGAYLLYACCTLHAAAPATSADSGSTSSRASHRPTSLS
jgi:hypothetical protein